MATVNPEASIQCGGLVPVIAVVYHRVVQQQTTVTGLAASMTILGMGLGNGLVVGDMFILDLNLATVQTGLHCSASTCVFIACLADLTLAATVLGAGVLGDKYGAKRMFIAGACGAGVFGLLAAAAPNAAVMIVARACIGMAFAFLCSLSLAIINAVFPAHQRAKAIAQYLAVIYVFGVAPPAIASLLVKNAGWRSGFLITAVLAILVVAITLRYVPETQRTDSKVDVPGLLLVAAALVGLIYGISKLENGLQFAALVPIAIGVLAGVAFVWWERRTDEPALDLGIFRSPRFDAAVIAGAAGRFVEAGGLITAGTDFGTPRMTDLPSTTVMVHGRNGSEQVSPYAFDERFDARLTPEQRDARAALRTLISQASALAAGASRVPYSPDRVIVYEVEPNNNTEPSTVGWPGPPLSSFLRPTTNRRARACGELDADPAEVVYQAALNNPGARWLVDGVTRLLAVNSLPLPGDCA